MPMPPPENPGENVEKAKESKGALLFDRVVYAGIAGVGTFVVTVPVAYELEHNARFRPVFEKAVQGVETGLSKLHINIAHDTARGVVKTTTLMQGGNLMLIPVAIAEHFKVPIVRGLNAMLGEKTPQDKIQEAPKQTMGSLLKSRGLAWLTVFGALTGVSKLYPKTLGTFEEETGRLVCRVLKRPEMRKNAGHLLEDTRTFGYGKLAAIDVFATAAAATLLYVGGHFFARKQEEKHERKLIRQANGGAHAELVESEPLVGSIEKAANTLAPVVRIQGEKQHHGLAEHAALTAQVS